MAMDLKNIIERIKEEGVDEAQKKAGDIIAQAETKAAATIADAEEKKKGIIDEAGAEALKLKASSEEAMRLASRARQSATPPRSPPIRTWAASGRSPSVASRICEPSWSITAIPTIRSLS